MKVLHPDFVVPLCFLFFYEFCWFRRLLELFVVLLFEILHVLFPDFLIVFGVFVDKEAVEGLIKVEVTFALVLVLLFGIEGWSFGLDFSIMLS